jgi:hypothetical protein
MTLISPFPIIFAICLEGRKDFLIFLRILILYFQRIINYIIVENSLLNNNSYNMMSFDIS